MIVNLVFIASAFLLTPIAIVLGKKAYFFAVEKGWNNPEQYATVPNSLLVIPAIGTMNLLEKLTGSDIFITTDKDASAANWIFYVLCAGLLVFLYCIPATMQINSFLKSQSKSKLHK